MQGPITQSDGDLLPWHQGCWDSLRRASRAGRMPHALLLTGVPGVGKRLLLRIFAGHLLCRQRGESDLACGQCDDCLLLAAGTHPDLVQIGPEEGGRSTEIRVDRVRALADTGALTAHRGGWKLFILDPAHRMNASAANALLKTLEEPAPDTLICLVSEEPRRLPATIRSRCQVQGVPTPPEQDALDWMRPRVKVGDPRVLLRLAYGGPLRALALADEEQMQMRDRLFGGFRDLSEGRRDPVAEAAAWNKAEPGILLSWLGGWVCDLLRLASGHPSPRLINPDKGEALTALARGLDARAGHGFLQRLWGLPDQDLGNLNAQLLYESLLLEWSGILGAGKGSTAGAGRPENTARRN